MVDAGALQYSNQSKLLALSKETAKKASWMDARAWKTQVTTLITYAVMSNRVAILPEIACIEYALPPLILLPEMNCLPFPRHCSEAACIPCESLPRAIGRFYIVVIPRHARTRSTSPTHTHCDRGVWSETR